MKSINIPRRFAGAIRRKDLSTARTLATLFEMTPAKLHLRVAAYRKVMDLALELGNGMAAQEVAPFAGHRLSKTDYLDCMGAAIERRDLQNIVWCSRYCGSRPSIHEIEWLGFNRNHFRAGGHAVLVKLVRKNLTEDDLSTQEILELWLAEALIP